MLAGLGLVGGVLPLRTAAADQVFTDRALFNADLGSAVTEDFEDSNVTDGGVLGCDAPVDATTNDVVCFDTGDIAPGLTATVRR